MHKETEAQKVNNLTNAIGQLLNSDIKNDPEFDPTNHLAALSMVLCNAAQMLGVRKDDLLLAAGHIYDAIADNLAPEDEVPPTATQ